MHHISFMHTIFTIGHSTHPIETFIETLKAYGIETLVDIRTIPQSRFNPQFAQKALAKSLTDAGIAYRHMKDLGGRRHARKDSPNTGWRNGGFRGYADYMQTEPFIRALGVLTAVAEQSSTAIMCAESVPWRCHRSLVGDALLVRGFTVIDIFSAENSRPHALTKFAQVEDGHILYPSPEPLLL